QPARLPADVSQEMDGPVRQRSPLRSDQTQLSRADAPKYQHLLQLSWLDSQNLHEARGLSDFGGKTVAEISARVCPHLAGQLRVHPRQRSEEPQDGTLSAANLLRLQPMGELHRRPSS